MRGNVKRKYFSLELKRAEDWSQHSAPCHALCQCVVTKILRDVFRSPGGSCSFLPRSSNVVADHREAVGGAGFGSLLSLLMGMSSCRTARSGQGRPDRCGEANPLPRGPFCDPGGRGKAEIGPGDSETRSKPDGCACVNHSSI